jgi:hypothetical protein
MLGSTEATRYRTPQLIEQASAPLLAVLVVAHSLGDELGVDRIRERRARSPCSRSARADASIRCRPAGFAAKPRCCGPRRDAVSSIHLPKVRMRSMELPETRYAKTVDGVHIAYQVRGDGADRHRLHPWLCGLFLEQSAYCSRMLGRSEENLTTEIDAVRVVTSDKHYQVLNKTIKTTTLDHFAIKGSHTVRTFDLIHTNGPAPP